MTRKSKKGSEIRCLLTYDLLSRVYSCLQQSLEGSGELNHQYQCLILESRQWIFVPRCSDSIVLYESTDSISSLSKPM